MLVLQARCGSQRFLHGMISIALVSYLDLLLHCIQLKVKMCAETKAGIARTRHDLPGPHSIAAFHHGTVRHQMQIHCLVPLVRAAQVYRIRFRKEVQVRAANVVAVSDKSNGAVKDGE